MADMHTACKHNPMLETLTCLQHAHKSQCSHSAQSIGTGLEHPDSWCLTPNTCRASPPNLNQPHGHIKVLGSKRLGAEKHLAWLAPLIQEAAGPSPLPSCKPLARPRGHAAYESTPEQPICQVNKGAPSKKDSKQLQTTSASKLNSWLDNKLRFVPRTLHNL